MKRFYKQAAAVEAPEGGYVVALDGRPVRTPGRSPLRLPGRALTAAVTAEWMAQGDRVVPATMPMTCIAYTALDLVPARRSEVVNDLAGYAETDLVCYRAERPAELAARQEAAWQPLIDWAAAEFDAPLISTSGILPCEQSPAALAALRRAVDAFDDLQLAALANLVRGLGSLVLALAVAKGRLSADEAFALSRLDESYQNESWGEDAEAAARRAALREEMEAAGRFLELLQAG